MSGLEEVGIQGPDHLREALTNCTDPLAAIEEFQIQNGILLPSLRPALPFLDLHGVLRLEFHQSVMEELRDKLLQRIREIATTANTGSPADKTRGHKLLGELLAKSFPVIRVRQLRPVVMCLLQHLPKIKHEYLATVVADKELYTEAPVEVKQHIWQENQALFGDEVSPLFSRYIDMKEAALFTLETSQAAFFQSSPKTRRQEEVVQELVKMIGRNVRLYDMVLQFLRTLFMRTRNVHYCTLRAELLMALHDAEINEIASVDPCHKFTWCLDACLRDRHVDGKRARELHGFLDSMHQRHQEQVLGDIAMILCDYQSIQVLATSVMKCLQHCVATETLPRYSDDLVFTLRMLSLGLGAWQVIDSQVFVEPKLDAVVVTRFLPAVLCHMADEQLKEDHVEAGPAWHLSSDPVTSTLIVHYVLHVIRQANVAAVLQILPLAVTQCDIDVVYSDASLHDLVSALAALPMAESFANSELCDTVFNKFFLPYISRENVLRHLLRLVYFVHQHINPTVLSKLVKSLAVGSQHSDLAHSAHQAVMDKVSVILAAASDASSSST